ncbi:hypothetical protein MtrunA17_Chr1g0201861 [Medicago truncatula]|uniref:Uncharacterized protein n=1 Tax=Medicago truncatula TaxID=3880 RepID=A0A396JTR9_MEDTR|nr:hypothetical protein MtrunA17_Chr1g0201861 [Medicago truncatula]
MRIPNGYLQNLLLAEELSNCLGYWLSVINYLNLISTVPFPQRKDRNILYECAICYQQQSYDIAFLFLRQNHSFLFIILYCQSTVLRGSLGATVKLLSCD